MEYKPSDEILEKYAKLLVNFGLNNAKGVNKGDIVLVQISECARPILNFVNREIIKAGANPIIDLRADGIARDMFEFGNEEQIGFFPEKFMKGKIDEADHLLQIIGDHDLDELKGIEPKKILLKQKAYSPYMKWRNDKEHAGNFSWTLVGYGTPAMAKEANLSLEEYWDEIIKACYLDKEDPVSEWKKIDAEIKRVSNELTDLKIQKVHVESEDIDLWVQLGSNRKWLCGVGINIPSYEIFISPDWRGTNGKIRFTEPLYSYGNKITDIELEFKDGLIINSSASEGEDILKEMIATKGANKIGEFSLTDSRISRITKFMADTLYDENVGGEFGNTHIAIGSSYKDSFIGDLDKTDEEWDELGFNCSVVHTDIVSTANRKVTAYLPDGSTKVIYDKGEFKV
ncbi:MAG: aminopeptidase [Candidatus Woesearchaeota archaeon]|jgi:aminopeptidase|nr:aminopeptidase [Candidatus Woesearchaeota archaeon]